MLENSKIGKGKDEILLFALKLRYIKQSGIEKYYHKIFVNIKYLLYILNERTVCAPEFFFFF